MKSRVSVIIPTRDRVRLLRQALSSVRSAEGPDLELDLIVVDNGTDPETPEVAASFGATYVKLAPCGASAARNEGFRRAKSEFVTFLDDDDVWLEGHIRPHLQLLATNPEFDAIVGQIQLTDFDLNPINAPYPDTLPPDGNVLKSFLRQTPQIGATVVRLGVRDTVGFFDEALESSEDWDWHLRLAQRHKIGFVRVPCVLFRQRRLSTHDDLQWMRMGYVWKVMMRAIRAAGDQRPSRSWVMRTYIAFRGHYFWYFTESAALHARKGEQAQARRAFYRAVRSSPLHAGRDLLRRSSFRGIIPYIIGLGDAPPAP